MSKIVRAANVMISNPDKITNVREKDSEYIFRYNDKYTWAMNVYDGVLRLKYFYDNPEVETILNMNPDEYNFYEGFIVYSAKELGTPEAQSTFKELFSLVKEKCFGMNEVLDDIIKSDEEDPF